MKFLVGNARNLMLMSNDAEEKSLAPRVELVLMLAEPKWDADAGGFVKRRELSSVRIIASPDQLRDLAAALGSMADDADRLAASAVDSRAEKQLDLTGGA